MSTLLPSLSARPLVSNGIAAGIPPLPVFVATPAPVRINQVSRVNARTPRPGAAPKLTADLAPVLRQWVIGGPVAQGLDRANWTYAERADHLLKRRGLRIGRSALQVFCQRHDTRPYRPTYRFLRGDPAKQAAARGDLAALKKKPRPATSSC